MKHPLAATVMLLVVSMGLTACGSEDSATGSPEATVSAEAEPQAETTDATETTMPEGARPASADFPFPVPAGWTELAAFAEEKVGKNIAMSATYGFTGEPDAASEAYQRLLEAAGYEIHPNPLGEQVHDASFIAKGKVNGTDYAGTLDFDTDAAGTPRVVINLSQ